MYNSYAETNVVFSLVYNEFVNYMKRGKDKRESNAW